MIHALKTEHELFEDVISGKKPFEVRKNDRDFKVGDFLALNEISINEEAPFPVSSIPTHTGRCCLVEVTYILEDTRFAKEGYATLGIRPCAISMTTEHIRFICEGGERFFAVPEYGRKSHDNKTNHRF